MLPRSTKRGSHVRRRMGFVLLACGCMGVHCVNSDCPTMCVCVGICVVHRVLCDHAMLDGSMGPLLVPTRERVRGDCVLVDYVQTYMHRVLQRLAFRWRRRIE